MADEEQPPEDVHSFEEAKDKPFERPPIEFDDETWASDWTPTDQEVAAQASTIRDLEGAAEALSESYSQLSNSANETDYKERFVVFRQRYAIYRQHLKTLKEQSKQARLKDAEAQEAWKRAAETVRAAKDTIHLLSETSWKQFTGFMHRQADTGEQLAKLLDQKATARRESRDEFRRVWIENKKTLSDAKIEAAKKRDKSKQLASKLATKFKAEAKTREAERQEMLAEEERQRMEVLDADKQGHEKEEFELQRNANAEAFEIDRADLADKFDFELKGLKLKHERQLKRRQVKSDVKSQARTANQGLKKFFTGFHNGFFNMFYKIKVAKLDRSKLPTPEELITAIIFVKYLQFLHKEFTFEKQFSELQREFQERMGYIRLPRAIVYAQTVRECNEQIASLLGELDAISERGDALDNAPDNDDTAAEVAALTARTEEIATDINALKQYLAYLTKPKGFMLLKSIGNPKQHQSAPKEGKALRPIHFRSPEEIANVVTPFANHLWKWAMLYVLQPLYLNMFRSYWTGQEIEDFMADFMSDDKKKRANDLFMSALLHRFNGWPSFLIWFGRNSEARFEDIESFLQGEEYAFEKLGLLGRLFTKVGFEIDRKVYRGIKSAPNGKSVVTVITGEVRTFGEVTNAFLVAMKQHMEELGNNAFSETFQNYVDDFFNNVAAKRILLPRFPHDNLRTRNFSNLNGILHTLKIIFCRELYNRATYDSSGKTKEEIHEEFRRAIAQDGFNRTMIDSLFARRHFLYFIFESHRPTYLGIWDIHRSVLLKPFFGKLPEKLKDANSFDHVAEMLAEQLAEKRTAEAKKIEEKKRKKAQKGKLNGEFYWMFWAFESEEDVNKLQGHYPRVYSKRELARYIESKQKDVQALLENSKDTEGKVVGNFLGASGVTLINVEFGDRVADLNDWNKFPVIGLGTAIAPESVRKLASGTKNQQEKYSRHDPYELHWKWQFVRVGEARQEQKIGELPEVLQNMISNHIGDNIDVSELSVPEFQRYLQAIKPITDAQKAEIERLKAENQQTQAELGQQAIHSQISQAKAEGAMKGMSAATAAMMGRQQTRAPRDPEEPEEGDQQ